MENAFFWFKVLNFSGMFWKVSFSSVWDELKIFKPRCVTFLLA